MWPAAKMTEAGASVQWLGSMVGYATLIRRLNECKKHVFQEDPLYGFYLWLKAKGLKMEDGKLKVQLRYFFLPG